MDSRYSFAKTACSGHYPRIAWIQPLIFLSLFKFPPCRSVSNTAFSYKFLDYKVFQISGPFVSAKNESTEYRREYPYHTCPDAAETRTAGKLWLGHFLRLWRIKESVKFFKIKISNFLKNSVKMFSKIFQSFSTRFYTCKKLFRRRKYLVKSASYRIASESKLEFLFFVKL